MEARTVNNPALRWEALSRWALAWDPLLDRTELTGWAGQLSEVMTAVADSAVIWSPTTDTIVAPRSRSSTDLDGRMWRAIELLTGIEP
ncbi:hypothetical protein [Rhodococcus sp. NPDC004095]